jgi:uncharacterized protein (DUF952 family)
MKFFKPKLNPVLKPQFIYHIVTPEQWAKWEGKPTYEDPSLHTEGFIHCSYQNQIDGVLSRYYKGVPSVVVLKIDRNKLSPLVKEELAPIGELFPHVFGAINQNCILEADETSNEPMPGLVV